MLEEGTQFDKFMDDILIKEARQVKRDAKEEELPLHVRANGLRRENPGHLIRYGGTFSRHPGIRYRG